MKFTIILAKCSSCNLIYLCKIWELGEWLLIPFTTATDKPNAIKNSNTTTSKTKVNYSLGNHLKDEFWHQQRSF